MWRRRRSHHGQQDLQHRDVMLHPAPTCHHRQRPASDASNSSSLSSSYHSHNDNNNNSNNVHQSWIMAPRVDIWRQQQQGEDILTVDESIPSVLTAKSTWQEEAHWMSFQNALLKFTTTLKIEEEPSPSTSLNGSFVSATSRGNHQHQQNTLNYNNQLPSSSFDPPLPQILDLKGSLGHHNSEEVNFGSDSFSYAEGLSGDDQLQSSSNQRALAGGLPMLASHKEPLPTPTAPTGSKNSTGSSKAKSQNCGSSKKKEASDDSSTLLLSMASELSETKMRLALAQAERDELEFALLMAGGAESGSSV